MKINFKRILLTCTTICFALIPFIFWNKSPMVGGDDSRLYYLYPQEYLENFTTKFISTNQPGSMGNYFAQSYLSPFLLVLSTIKQLLPFLNLQKVFLGLNVAASFYFFYLFLSSFFKKFNFYPKYLASVFYTTSIFTYFTVWQHQLFPVYLTSYLPLALFLFIKSVENKKIILITLLSLVTFLYSFVLYSIPWIAAALIVISPILIDLFLKHKKTFIKHTLIFLILSFFLNLHWLFHFLYSPLSSSISRDVVSNTMIEESIDANSHNIYAVARDNQLLYSFTNLFQKKIQENFSWPTLDVYQKDYLHLLIPNLGFLLLILLASVVPKKESSKEKCLISLSSFLLACYFFTVSIGNWGLNLFIKLNQYIPGFTMFRNMGDKFGIAIAFSFAALLAISLDVLIRKIKNKQIKDVLLILVSILVFFNSKGFITGSLFEIEYGNTKKFNNLNDFHQDFIDLAKYLKDRNYNSRVLSLPINTANYLIIPDQMNSNFYYMGVSPLRFLSDCNDLNGLLSFNSGQANLIEKQLNQKDYLGAAEVFRQLNSEYILINNDINKNIQNSYLYTKNQAADFYNIQTGLIEELKGNKIKDFGENYSLYSINQKYQNKKIYLTNDLNKFPNNFNAVEFKKTNDHKYEINIKDSSFKYLVFLDPYQELWQLEINGKPTPEIESKQTLVWNYANAWDISSTDKKKFTLYFKAADYIYTTRVISLISLGLTLIVFIWQIKSLKKS